MRTHGRAAATVALVLLCLGTPVVAFQHPRGPSGGKQQAAPDPPSHELKVGKSDDIEFANEVRVGEVTLKPGKYRLRHRVQGADHFVHFERLLITTPSAQKLATGLAVPAGAAGEVRCRLEPLGAKAQQTLLYLLKKAEGGQRLTKVLISGENVAHVF